jgi:hypothetical protein
MAEIKVVRVQTNLHKNVVVRVEYEDGVLRVLFAGRSSVLPLDPMAADPMAAKIEVANLLKRLGTDLVNLELDRINVVRPAAEESAGRDSL